MKSPYKLYEEKTYNIGEILVKPCILRAAKLVFGEDSNQKLSEISLSDSTVKLLIDELADKGPYSQRF